MTRRAKASGTERTSCDGAVHRVPVTGVRHWGSSARRPPLSSRSITGIAPLVAGPLDQQVGHVGAPGAGRVGQHGPTRLRPRLQVGVDDPPGLLDLVGPDEQGGVTHHGVVDEALVAVGGLLAGEGLGVVEVHGHRAEVELLAGDLGPELEADPLVGLDAQDQGVGPEVATGALVEQEERAPAGRSGPPRSPGPAAACRCARRWGPRPSASSPPGAGGPGRSRSGCRGRRPAPGGSRAPSRRR